MSAFCFFIALWLWRYVRLFVHALASWGFQPTMPSTKPTFLPADVTVVIPTLRGEGDVFMRCVASVAANNPYRIIVVTPFQNVRRVKQNLCPWSSVSVIGVAKPNKRRQMVEGLVLVRTAITVFVDDDVVWPSTYLHFILAAFEDPDVGAASTSQRLRRIPNPSIWHFLGAIYLERRNFEFSATTRIDGGISALSGRTQALRTHILQDESFVDEFLNETWLGSFSLGTADDDVFITRWLLNNHWNIRIQYCNEAELQTTFPDSLLFLRQCIRWSRTTWRSNITSMFTERKIWRNQPWCCYALHLSTFNPPAIIMDGTLAYLLYNSAKELLPKHVGGVMLGFAIWLLLTKTLKLVPHYYRYPQDVKFIPVLILFGYLHGFIKIYALFTIHKIGWESADAHDDCQPLLEDPSLGTTDGNVG